MHIVIDAKHKTDLNSRITTDEVNGFAHSVKCFEIYKNGVAIQFSKPLEILTNNAIITNGRPHLDCDRMLADYNCIMIFNFHPTKSFQVVR